MRKELFLVILGTLLFNLTGCVNNDKSEVNGEIANEFALELDRKQNCSLSVEEYVQIEDRRVYLVCLNEIYWKDQYGTSPLKEHWKNTNQSFSTNVDEIIASLKQIYMLKDGGTTIYRNDDMTLIKCNTLMGNKDIYIGDSSLDYQNNFCEEKMGTLVQTYTVLHVEPSNDDEYLWLTLKQFQGEEVASVRVAKDFVKGIKEKDTYEFTFQANRSLIISDILAVFQDSTLISAQKTEKIGLDQENGWVE